ncbi:hypothetical protein ACFE04_014830 [Oxalis oulophora]
MIPEGSKSRITCLAFLVFHENNGALVRDIINMATYRKSDLDAFQSSADKKISQSIGFHSAIGAASALSACSKIEFVIFIVLAQNEAKLKPLLGGDKVAENSVQIQEIEIKSLTLEPSGNNRFLVIDVARCMTSDVAPYCEKQCELQKNLLANKVFVRNVHRGIGKLDFRQRHGVNLHDSSCCWEDLVTVKVASTTIDTRELCLCQ